MKKKGEYGIEAKRLTFWIKYHTILAVLFGTMIFSVYFIDDLLFKWGITIIGVLGCFSNLIIVSIYVLERKIDRILRGLEDEKER